MENNITNNNTTKKYTNNTSIKSIIWNTAGSLFNAASSMILLILVTRIDGNSKAGIFAFAFSISQLFYTIGNLEVRPYQSTDVDEKYSFRDYLSLRVLSCIMMMIAAYIYIVFYGYSYEKSIMILLLCIYRMTDAFSDVFQGFFQIRDRLDLSGKSLALRVVFSTIIFYIVMIISKDLVISSIAMIITCILWIILFDFINCRRFSRIEVCYNKDSIQKIWNLVKECMPLFLGAFLLMYIFNIPKVSIDKLMESDMQNFFNIIFMPVSIINLFSIFLFRPVLTTLADYFNKCNIKGFLSITFKLVMWIVFLTIVFEIASYYLGIPILSVIYDTNLYSYKKELLIMMVGGGFSALSTLLHYVITVMRKQNSLLIGYLTVAAFGTIISDKFINSYGIMGASYIYLILMLLLSVIFVITMSFHIIKGKLQKDNRSQTK